MIKFKEFWRSLFDVRPGEHLITALMALYMIFVLFAYYILKPVSRALFVHKFEIETLPGLYILIAAVGGLLAYGYTKVAVNTTLSRAVTAATAFLTSGLVALWWLLKYDWDWVLYAFNIWVSMFAIVLVSQGWLIAANVFDSRQAKRLYGIVGVGAVVGAAFGGTFTSLLVHRIGPRFLLVASAAMVVLAYVVFRFVAALNKEALATATAAEEEQASFSLRDLAGSIAHYRHLQVIMAIIGLTYVVDVLIEYQFSAMAKVAYPDKAQLVAFLGRFYGLYLNLITFFLQFFLTVTVVGRFGVGGALQAMPVSIGIASVVTYLFPGLTTASAARLVEASTRYSFNRTGMELLYLPLPIELKNRTKAFIDVFADRFSRGLGGILLLLLTVKLGVSPRGIALVAVVLSVAWIMLSDRARRHYIATICERLAMRRLDLKAARVSLCDPALLRLLEQTARGANARQAVYALSMLADAPDYSITPLLEELVASPSDEVRAKVFDLGSACGYSGLLGQALSEIRSARPSAASAAVPPAVAYALATSSERASLARCLLDHPNPRVIEADLESISCMPDLAQELITRDWLAAASQAADAERRRLAAVAVGVRGDDGVETLHGLLRDADRSVVAAACRAAGRLGNRSYVDALVAHLADSRLRSVVIDALSASGPRLVGTLSDVLEDETVSVAIRQHVPRVLRLIPDQRSVDALLRAIAQPNLTVRSAVLRALNRLRENAPQLRYDGASLTQDMETEARRCYELRAVQAPFRGCSDLRTAPGLLARTLEERWCRSLERLFRMLGLRYPPKEIYATYLAVQRQRHQEFSIALDFLDSTLERDIKRYLMPLLDASDQRHSGCELFGIQDLDAPTALRELIHSDDPWLVACAVATAADLGLRNLLPEIRELRGAGPQVAPVAAVAMAALV